jgi:hypothetical protein
MGMTARSQRGTFTITHKAQGIFIMTTTRNFFDESREQSLVKATIVSKYFWAWAKVIISTVNKRQGGKIAYIDLFAGPGRYKDGTKSTPLLVLEKAIQDPDLSPMTQMPGTHNRLIMR